MLALSGDELEQAYIESQVAAHGAALQLIDAMLLAADSDALDAELTQLIDAMLLAADSDALDAELTQLRASVAGHLNEQLVTIESSRWWRPTSPWSARSR